VLAHRTTPWALLRNWLIVWVANCLGALLYAAAFYGAVPGGAASLLSIPLFPV